MKFRSQVFTQVSGSVGGLTYAHNAGGLYTRSRAIPTNPNSPQQMAVRAAVANLSNLWGTTLTDAQRIVWDFYAFNTPVIDKLGQQINLSGINMYIRGNTPRLQQGLPRADTGPLVFNLGDYTDPSFSIDAAADTIDVTFDNTDAWANEDDAAMLVYCSRPQSPTINYFKGPYRLAGAILGDSTTAPTSPATIDLPFAVAADQKVFVRTAVTRADGRLSLSFRGFAIAA